MSIIVQRGSSISITGAPFSPGQDLSGTNTAQTVIGIQDIPVSSTAPVAGQVLEFNGTEYVPTTITTSPTTDYTTIFLLMGS